MVSGIDGAAPLPGMIRGDLVAAEAREGGGAGGGREGGGTGEGGNEGGE